MSTFLSSGPQAGDDRKSNPFAPSSCSRKFPEASGYDITDNKPPPPAYSRRSSDNIGHVERGDDLDLLKEYDTVILMDDSKSMTATCTSNLKPKSGESSRWDVAMQAIEPLAAMLSRYDTDGIDVYFLNARLPRELCTHLKSEAAVRRLFTQVTPTGGTPMRRNLDMILDPYVCDYEAFAEQPETRERGKPCNLIIITDGDCRSTNPREDVAALIRNFKRRLAVADEKLDKKGWRPNSNTAHWSHHGPRRPIGLQFLQIGTDKGCKKWLEQLDNDMQEDSYDIVDHRLYNRKTGFTEEQLMEAVIGGISRVYDHKQVKSSCWSRLGTVVSRLRCGT